MGHNQHRHPNQLRWLTPPSKELIRKVIKESGVSIFQFERFYGIVHKGVANVLADQTNKKYNRDLPAKYWHLFYDRVPERKQAMQKPKKQRATKSKAINDPALLALGIVA